MGKLSVSNKQIFCALICCLCLSIAEAQTLQGYKPKYPDDKYVYLKSNEQVNITYNKTGGLSIAMDAEEEVFYLDDWAANLSERHIVFSNLFNLTSYEAYSLIPLGNGKFNKKQVTEFKYVDKYKSDNFHDDLKAYTFYFSALKAGSVSYLKHQTTTEDPFLVGSFDFGKEVPVVQSVLTITYPSDVVIQAQLQNADKYKLKADTTYKKGFTTIQFSMSDLPAIRSERGAPTIKSYRPVILFSVVSYMKGTEKVKVLENATDLSKWYCSLMKKADNQMPDALKTIADSISRSFSDEESKVKAVYYWVQDNIRYISIQEGMGGFIPATVQSCFQQRYGDCKAVSNMTHQMLKYMGIPANLALVGTREIPYSYRKIPGTFIDNHMIAMYKSAKNGWQILDATGKFVPYSSVPSFIQGKEILIVNEDCSYEIFDVPVIESKNNVSIDSLVISIDNTLIKGKGVEKYGGQENIDINDLLMSLNAEELEKFYLNHFRRGSNKCTVLNYASKNLGNRSENVELNYEIELRDYVVKLDDELIINPHLKRPFASAKIDTSILKLDREYENCGQYIFDLTIQIPDGYVLDYVPESKSYQLPSFGFDLQYSVEGNIIRHRSVVSLHALILKREYFGQWNDIIKQLNKSYNDAIVLKRKA